MRRKRIDLDTKSEGSPIAEKSAQVQAQPNIGQGGKADNDEEKTASNDKADDEADQGHRYGNFRNYYTFHPPSNRIQRLGEIIDYVVENRKPEKLAKRPKTDDDAGSSIVKEDYFRYCDVGCNEGDLTMEVSSAIQSRLADDMSMTTTGVDLDGTLIERANSKVKESKSGTKADFLKADVCALDQLDGSIPDGLDLLSLFSTTMWLHIHAGDDGFREIIKKLCAKTRGFFLIEPQPSKWYAAF
jgi:hypothetical protein